MDSSLLNIIPVLEQQGIEYVKGNGHVKICCPYHHEKTPSMTIYDDNCCYCYGCNKRVWHDELVAEICGCSLVEAKKKLGTYDPNMQYDYAEPTNDKMTKYEFADPPKDFTESFKKLPQEIPPEMLEFLKGKGLDKYYEKGLWRWLPKHTFKCWENQEGICIPYFGPNFEITTFRLRQYDRMRNKFGHPLAPKGVPLQPSYMVVDPEKPCYLCEGESDSLSVYSTNRNVICLPGVGAHKQLHSALLQLFEWKVPKIIFCGDNDEAGHKFNKYAITAALNLGLGKYTPQLRVLHLPDEYNALPDGSFKRKDLNDFLKEGRLDKILNEFEAIDEKIGKGLIQKEDNIAKIVSEVVAEKKEDNWSKVFSSIKATFGDGITEIPEDVIGDIF